MLTRLSAALLLLLAAAAPLQAAVCTANGVRRFETSLRAAADCWQTRATTGERGICSIPSPPACAVDAFARFESLFGAPAAAPSRRASPSVKAARRCQANLTRSARRFVGARLAEVGHEARRQTDSRQQLESTAARWCNVAVARVGRGTLPAFGGSCGAALPPAGERIAPAALSRCLRTELARITQAVAPQPLRPNIVVVMTDDQRWDALHVMPVVLGRLVAEGIDFRESFVTSPVCCPSRASFFSGRYAHNTGVRDNRPPLGGAPLFDEDTSSALALFSAGYRTGLFGKYMNATDLLTHVPAGWDSWNAFVSDGSNYFDYLLNRSGSITAYGAAEADYSTDVLRDMALEFVDTHADEPFFLVYTPFAPHSDVDFFSTRPAPRHAGSLAAIALPRRPSYLEADVSDKPAWLTAPQAILRFLGRRDVADRYFELADELAIGQLESLLAVDEAVGALLDRLAALGLEDDTVFVFTSDNGFSWGEHRWVGKRVAYDESIRVPLVIRYPLGIERARRDDRIVLNIDLAPTFAELAGAALPAGVNGRSLTPLFDGAEVPWREDFLAEQVFANFLLPVDTYAMVRSREWKYVLYENGNEELYDLSSDPDELVNRSADPALAAPRAALRARLEELLAE